MAFFTRLSTSLKLCVLCFFLGSAATAGAESIRVSRAQASVTDAGRLSVNTRFVTTLPDQLKQALQQGVPLRFDLSYRLTAPTVVSYRNSLSNLFGGDSLIQYKLAFHPLTNRYRVSMGTFSTEYGTLDVALKAVGAVANWTVLQTGALSGTPASAVRADVRLGLSIASLPKPFQINALTSRNWQLDSGWQPLSIAAD